jgi:hypothetical protein
MIKNMGAIRFILEKGEAWLQYATRVNILNESKDCLIDLSENY